MCISGGIWGAGRLKPKHRQLYLKYYLPWAIRTGNNAKFLQGIFLNRFKSSITAMNVLTATVIIPRFHDKAHILHNI